MIDDINSLGYMSCHNIALHNVPRRATMCVCHNVVEASSHDATRIINIIITNVNLVV